MRDLFFSNNAVILEKHILVFLFDDSIVVTSSTMTIDASMVAGQDTKKCPPTPLEVVLPLSNGTLGASAGAANGFALVNQYRASRLRYVAFRRSLSKCAGAELLLPLVVLLAVECCCHQLFSTIRNRVIVQVRLTCWGSVVSSCYILRLMAIVSAR